MVNGIHIYDMHYSSNVVDHVSEEYRSRYPGNEEKEYDNNVTEGVDKGKEEERVTERSIPWFLSQPHKKRQKSVIVDRISGLHDSILLHILSFLNMQEAVCTSVLSKRWKSLWTSLPTLRFQNRRCLPEKVLPFVESVTRTLENYRAGNIKMFAVDFSYSSCFASNVDNWILFAIQNKVEDLDLRLHLCLPYTVDKDVQESYTLPYYVYCAPSLTKLSLLNCISGLKGAVSWGSLKSLSITKVDLTEDTIKIILSGSPVLEFLKINACRGINYLDINSASVKTLVIQNFNAECRDGLLLEISAPYIQSLHILGTAYGRFFRLINVSSLVTANLNYYFGHGGRRMCVFTKQLIENIGHVKEIKLGPYCIQVLTMLERLGWISPPSSWKHLVVNAHLDNLDTLGIVRLLHSSPIIETVIINRTRVGCSILLRHLYSTGRGKICLAGARFPRLKTVKICGHTGVGILCEPTVELIKLLLENADVLEKIIIFVSPGTDYMAEVQELLSLPRSSRHAEIVFRHRNAY
ncbi:F-box/LRR-repeat protein [Abeliophyllum distichum]|uniref:F-box/LRR-repeat protein n=1 Tax=Abeliophyllum distichum TaxID=126358 RepID=A0ABD1QWJ5_9LAMI